MTGGGVHLVSRGRRPAALAHYDPAADRVTACVDLPTGEGGWAVCEMGGLVYAGTYVPADVHRWDRGTGAVTTPARFGREQFVWSLAASTAAGAGAGGTVYAGTYPGGLVYRLGREGVVRDVGAAGRGRHCVRVLACAPDGTVYAGTGTPAGLVELRPGGGARRDVLPRELAGESLVVAVAVTGDLVVAGTEPSGLLALVDRRDPRRYAVLETGERAVDAVTVAAGSVFCAGRPSGTLYETAAAVATGGSLRSVAVPVRGTETRCLGGYGADLVGVTGGGAVWRRSAGSGRTVATDLVDAGLPAWPEPPQSLAVLPDAAVLAAGNVALQVRDLRSGRGVVRHRLRGEAKVAATVGEVVYLAVYPGAELVAYDHDRAAVRDVAVVGGGQNRPLALHHATSCGLLLLGTRAGYGHTGGALAAYDLREGRLRRYVGVLPGQGVRAIATDGTTAYLGGDVAADGTPAVAGTADLAAFDLRSGVVLWRWAPRAETTAYADVAVHGGLLYVLGEDGLLLVVDPAARRVLARHALPGPPGRFVETGDGRLFCVTGTHVVLVTPARVHTVVAGLDGGWFNAPQPAYDPVTGHLYTLRGRDLVRLRLAPAQLLPAAGEE